LLAADEVAAVLPVIGVAVPVVLVVHPPTSTSAAAIRPIRTTLDRT
jgi:hypothetical protein